MLCYFVGFFLQKNQVVPYKNLSLSYPFLCTYIVRYMTEALKTIYAVLST